VKVESLSNSPALRVPKAFAEEIGATSDLCYSGALTPSMSIAIRQPRA
jgi:antitoxin component of MazEF toxin-antitoxin module